jgi:nucleoside-diphosphate-sugar epimerase
MGQGATGVSDVSSKVWQNMTGNGVDPRSQRVLVTGAGGFIGSHLAVALLELGHRVVALDLDLERIRHLETPDRLQLLEADVCDSEVQHEALDGVGVVYHLAAAHLGVATKDEEFWRVNRDGVRTFADSAAQAGVSRFVHCSTVGVFGRLREVPADETMTCRPELIYDKSKLAGEGVVLEAARRGLPAVILRPVWVYGPGCPRTEKLFRALEKGRFVVAGGGGALRHCVYIKDMVEAFLLAATAAKAVGEIIVVGDTGAVTVRHLVDEMAGLAGRRPPRSVPLPLMLLMAAAMETACRSLGKEPPISRRTLRFFTDNTSFDTTRAGTLLGFEPQYDLGPGLAETYAQLRGERPWQLAFSDADRDPDLAKEGAADL